jgi:hypothetical protein
VLPAGFVVLAPVAFVREPRPPISPAIGYAGLAALVFGIGLRRYQRGETPTSSACLASSARPYWLAWSMAAIFQSPLEVRA